MQLLLGFVMRNYFTVAFMNAFKRQDVHFNGVCNGLGILAYQKR